MLFGMQQQQAALAAGPVSQTVDICILGQNQYFGDEEVHRAQQPARRGNSARIKSDRAEVYRIEWAALLRCLKSSHQNLQNFLQLSAQKYQWEARREQEIALQMQEQMRAQQRLLQQQQNAEKQQRLAQKAQQFLRPHPSAENSPDNRSPSVKRQSPEPTRSNSQATLVPPASSAPRSGNSNVVQAILEAEQTNNYSLAPSRKSSVQDVLRLAKRRQKDINFLRNIESMIAYKDSFQKKNTSPEGLQRNILQLMELKKDPFYPDKTKKKFNKRKASEPNLSSQQQLTGSEEVLLTNNSHARKIQELYQMQERRFPLEQEPTNTSTAVQTGHLEPIIELRGLLSKRASARFLENGLPNIYQRIQLAPAASQVIDRAYNSLSRSLEKSLQQQPPQLHRLREARSTSEFNLHTLKLRSVQKKKPQNALINQNSSRLFKKDPFSENFILDKGFQIQRYSPLQIKGQL